jgi:hypothetical protein
MNRNIIIRGVLFILLGSVLLILVIYLFDYFFIKKVVNLNPINNSTITLIKTDNNKEITITTKQKTVRVRSGNYTVKYSGGGEYEDINKQIEINSITTLTTPNLNYSSKKLLSILKQFKPSINSVLSKDPRFKDYLIENEAMYIRGEWYGARLIPKDWYDPSVPADYDPRPINENNTKEVLKIIMQNSGGEWKIIAGPVIVFNLEENKNIPEEVLRKVNKLGF